jgi:signal transduction histidine kinase
MVGVNRESGMTGLEPVAAIQRGAAEWLAQRRIVTGDLDMLRMRASRFFAILLWVHVPVIAAIAFSNGISAWRPTLIMAGAALAGSLAAWRAGSSLVARLSMAVCLTVAPAMMVYAGRGLWQVDWHMYFFVVFGMLVAYVDWRPIALAAGLTIVHHLALDLFFPANVFPEPGLGRVVLHAALVIVDCVVLFWIVSQMERLFATSSAALKIAQENAAEAQRLESYAKHGSDLIMQAVNQGLLLCDSQYLIQPQYSAELEKIFETQDLAGRNLLALLQGLLTERLFATVRDYMALLFDVKKKERTVLKVNPLGEVECSFWKQAGGSFSSKFLSFSFRRIIENGEVVRVFVAVNDISDRVKLERQLNEAEQKKQRQVELLLSILHISPDALDEFIATAKEQIHTMDDTLRPQDFASVGAGHRELLRKRLDTIFRCVHNVKGNAALTKFDYFQKRADDFETKLEEIRNRSALGGDDFLSVVFAQSSLRSDIEELEDLRSKFASVPQRNESPGGVALRGQVGEDLVVAIRDLAASIARKLGKEVRVDAAGLDFRELDGAQRRAIKDVLIQLTRNSLTHGIELPELRSLSGKNQCGTLTIRPIEGPPNEFGFVFRDDGRGFDTERIRNRAARQGLLPPGIHRSYDDSEIARLVFEPGFSTADETTADAGRGMGMNVVKQRIVDECKGTITVNSEPGQFCEFQIVIPVAALARI